MKVCVTGGLILNPKNIKDCQQSPETTERFSCHHCPQQNQEEATLSPATFSVPEVVASRGNEL